MLDKTCNLTGAAIAQWIRLHLLSCCTGFESQAFMLLSPTVKFVLYLSCKKNKNKQKEPGFGPFLNMQFTFEPK